MAFFELSGVLVNYDLIDQNGYFDMFNLAPFWEKAKPIVEGMRKKDLTSMRNLSY
ncbi:MAG TPA: hypothetical protein VE619_04605 [Nitrososphaeraceae archaeon]|nr:hypothetical protein [Nitrososphaeraceae archaeon]